MADTVGGTDRMAGHMPLAQIEHSIPGRVRLRLRAMRDDVPFFQRVEAELARWPHIRAVRSNARTGSLLVEHTGDPAIWIRNARDGGLFNAVRPEAPAARRSVVRPVPAPVVGSPLNLTAAGLAAAGTLQLMRGNVVGSASENLWNAYGLYAVARKPLASVVLVALGLMQIARGEVLGSATSLFLYAYSARRLARHRATEDTI